MLKRRDGTIKAFRNAQFIPAFYLIPESILNKCGHELCSIPRCLDELFKDEDAIATVESDLFRLCIIDAYAYMVWPYLCPKIPYMEIYSGNDPAWRLAHCAPIWINELEQQGFIPSFMELYEDGDPYQTFGFIPPEDLNNILNIIVPDAVIRNDLQPIMDAVKELRCFEDFDGRDSNQKTDFYRKWYHSRTKKAEFSLEGFQEQCKRYYDDIDWEIPDPLSSFEDEIGIKVDVDRFLKTLDDKDVRILQMRAEGYTNQEVADELGYKTHSAVIKRVRKIGEKYQKFSGLNFGF